MSKRAWLLAVTVPMLLAACRPDWGGPPPDRTPQQAPPAPAEANGAPLGRDPGPVAAGPVSLATKDPPRLLLGVDVRTRLVQRARAGDRAWVTLKAACDRLLGGKVEWPDGKGNGDPPNVNEGYQGSGYFGPLASIGLCHRIAADGGGGDAAKYGAKGAEILNRMSELSGPHAVAPLRDSGYGIRFYGVGMALGYDWLRDVLSREEKARIAAALDRWFRAYDKEGFGHEHPQGNYFAGYYAAKAFAGLAVEGDDALGAAWWKDWLERLHGKMVEPFYAKYLAGGGWPEGYHYGHLGTVNMCLPALAAATAKSMPLEKYRFPEDQALNLIHFSWPDRRTLDDRGAQKVGPAPSAAQAWLFTVMAGVLEMRHAPVAPVFHDYAREIRGLRGAEPADPWQEMLFWDEHAPLGDYKKLPLSYATSGMQTVAARSSWATDAVWASFTSGTYVNYPGSGEMSFDQGSLVIVKGGQPFLVNTEPTLKRNTPGTQDGNKFEDRLYDDNFGNNDANPALANRTLYNVFYSRAHHFGQAAYEDSSGAKTHLGAFEDGGPYVVFRGDRLEDMYRDAREVKRAVVRWTRQVVYLRPGTFVVDDRTEVPSAQADQWMAFHFCGRPLAVDGRFDVACAGGYAGSVTTLLPQNARSVVVDVFDSQKVFRLEERPGSAAAAQRWLNVFDVASPRAGTQRARRIATAEDATAGVGAVSGAALERPGAADAVVSAWGMRPASAVVRYSVSAADGLHVVTDLEPRATYRIEVVKTAPGMDVILRRGEGLAASANGVLAFRIAAGVVRAP